MIVLITREEAVKFNKTLSSKKRLKLSSKKLYFRKKKQLTRRKVNETVNELLESFVFSIHDFINKTDIRKCVSIAMSIYKKCFERCHDENRAKGLLLLLQLIYTVLKQKDGYLNENFIQSMSDDLKICLRKKLDELIPTKFQSDTQGQSENLKTDNTEAEENKCHEDNDNQNKDTNKELNEELTRFIYDALKNLTATNLTLRLPAH